MNQLADYSELSVLWDSSSAMMGKNQELIAKVTLQSLVKRKVGLIMSDEQTVADRRGGSNERFT